MPEYYDLAAHIDGHYTGDAERYRQYIDDTTRNTIEWNTLCQWEEYLPQYAEMAQNLIDKRLGYVPRQLTYKPHEPFIRELIHQSFSGQIIYYWEFCQRVDAHIRDIRNADMKDNPCMMKLPYDEEDYKRYETEFPEFKDEARNRIARLLGYLPDLEYSLDAEIYLRELFTKLDSKTRSIVTGCEFRAATFTSYRKAYLTSGIEAADESPLLGIAWGQDIIDRINSTLKF